MPNREELRHRSARDVPPVGRPRGAVWRSLQADGVVWEGQVQLVGDDHDLAARMIVTHRRVVFVRGGELVLDIPRGWLRPEPVLRRDGVLDLFVSMPGSNLFDEPMTVPLRMREGHPAAGHIIAMLAPSGVRRIAPDAVSAMERAREAAPAPRFGGFWDDDATDPLLTDNDRIGANGTFADGSHAASNGAHRPIPATIEPPDGVIRAPSSPQRRPAVNGYPITGLQPRNQRKSPWGLLLRLGALTLLLATAAALGAGRLDFGAPSAGSGATLSAPTPTVAAVSSPSTPPEAALQSEDESAIAIGVGGSVEQPDAPDWPSSAQPSASTPEPAATAAATAPAAVVVPTSPPPAPSTSAASSPPAAVEASPSSAALSQPAAVAADEPPAQEILVGPLRVAVSTALRAESLPRYALPPGAGEWVLLEVDVANEGDAPASLPMNDFRLFDRGIGRTADLDSGTDVIATLAGFDPTLSAGDVMTIEPGEPAEALLLYLLPPGSSEDVALIVGERSMDLAPALALGEVGTAAAPELVPAKVAAVLDGARITVDIGGLRETVHYLGMQAPASGACFAAEATAANAELVEGQEVWLERQSTDRGPDNALLRDVWIAGPNGERALVSARLLEIGAGTVASAAPDTRYAAWLGAASALARANGAGVWGACPTT